MESTKGAMIIREADLMNPMVEIKTRLKEVGSSLGLVIPKDEVIKNNLKPNQKVKVIVELQVKGVKVRDIFGKMINIKKPTEQILKELDEELDSKFFKK